MCELERERGLGQFFSRTFSSFSIFDRLFVLHYFQPRYEFSI